jgi:hypothetical protein
MNVRRKLLGSRYRPPSDLGPNNTARLEAAAAQFSNTTLVDLGVRFGYSSEALLRGSRGRGNIVHGVDINFDHLPRSLRLNPSYEYTAGDSATAGKYWNPLRTVSLLFVDTIHVKEMILTELLCWQPHWVVGSVIAFHDTHWDVGVFETIAGQTWERPEAAVVEFFGLPTHGDYEDDRVLVRTYPESNGMTFVTIKSEVDFSRNVPNWDVVVERRNIIINTYSSTRDISRLGIDLLGEYSKAASDQAQP